MLIYAAMVVALQSMSPSRRDTRRAHCARLVVEGCDASCRITVAVNSRIGCHTKKIVPDQLIRDLVERREEKTNWYAKETQFGDGNENHEDQYAGHSLRSTLSVLNVWILTRYIWPRGAHVLLC